MGGIEATRVIRKHEVDNTLDAVPIIALTAHAMLGDRERCLEAGMSDYLTKPLRKDHLLSMLVRVSTANRRRLAVTSSVTASHMPSLASVTTT